MGTDLVKINPQESWAIAVQISDAAVNSGLEKMKNKAEIALRVQYGMELGMGPAESLMNVHVVQGKPQLTTEALAAKVKSSGVYDYAVTRLDDTGCEIQFYQHGQPCGVSTFTDTDAKKAGLWGKKGPWTEHTRNMLFYRAMRNGVRFYCPDVTGGVILDLDQNPYDAPAAQPAAADTDEEVVTGEIVDEPTADPADVVITQDQRRRMFAIARERGGDEWEARLRRIIHDLTGQGSTAALSVAHYEQVIDRLEALDTEPTDQPKGAGDTDPDNHDAAGPDAVDQADLFGDTEEDQA